MTDKYITVIGGINADIIGTPAKRPVMHDSNPGSNTLYPGGVGRNIAENCAKLGIKTKLLSSIGNDYFGQFIQDATKHPNMDLSNLIISDKHNTSTYVCLNDENGDIHYAVNDMLVTELITPEYIESKLELINNSAAVVIDTNIPVETIKYICENVTVPIIADTVSENKAPKLMTVMNKLYAVKVNLLEAELMSGIHINNFYDAKDAAFKLQDKGIKNVFLTMGSNGVTYCGDLEAGILPAYKIKSVNTAGCGDAFTAAMVYGYINGLNAKKTALCGLACAALTLATEKTVSDEISPEAISKIIEEDNIL